MIPATADAEQARIYMRRWWVLAVLSFCVLTVVLSTTVINVALPTLQRELETTGSELQWIMNAYILAMAALVLTMGSLGDRLGRVYLLRAGMAIFAVASLGATFADAGSHLILARALMGVGAAMIQPATLAIITNVFPRGERGKAIGVWGAMNGASVALGPIVGGLIIEYSNWQGIFLLNVPLIAGAFIASYFVVPNSRDIHPRGLDPLGVLLSGTALASLVFGLIRGGDLGWTDPVVLGTILGSIAVGAIFVSWERSCRRPMLEMSLFRNMRFSAGVGSVTVVSLFVQGVFYSLSLYMQFVHGYTALETGIRFLPSAVGFALGSVTSPARVKRFGTNRVMAAGCIGAMAMAVSYSTWQVDTPYWQIFIFVTIWSYALGNVFTPALDCVLGAVPGGQAGVGSAMNNVSTQVGGAIGIAALGSVLATIYTSKIEPILDTIQGLPAAVTDAAKDSVGAAMRIADTLPAETGAALSMAARQSFMDGWQVMMYIVSGLAILTAIMTIRFVPPQHLPVESAVNSGDGLPGEACEEKSTSRVS